MAGAVLLTVAAFRSSVIAVVVARTKCTVTGGGSSPMSVARHGRRDGGQSGGRRARRSYLVPYYRYMPVSTLYEYPMIYRMYLYIQYQ